MQILGSVIPTSTSGGSGRDGAAVHLCCWHLSGNKVTDLFETAGRKRGPSSQVRHPHLPHPCHRQNRCSVALPLIPLVNSDPVSPLHELLQLPGWQKPLYWQLLGVDASKLRHLVSDGNCSLPAGRAAKRSAGGGPGPPVLLRGGQHCSGGSSPPAGSPAQAHSHVPRAFQLQPLAVVLRPHRGAGAAVPAATTAQPELLVSGLPGSVRAPLLQRCSLCSPGSSGECPIG